MYFVELSVRAQDFLEKLDKDTRERIEKRLKNLESNPANKKHLSILLLNL